MASPTRPTAARSPLVRTTSVRVPTLKGCTLKTHMYSQAADIGANASAEGGDDEGADDQAQTVIDVVHSFRLNETHFDKKSYLTHLKGVYIPSTCPRAQLTISRLHEGRQGQAPGEGCQRR